MRHYQSLSQKVQDELFFKISEPFDFTSDKDLLSAALGATLYSPSTRVDLFGDLIKMKDKGAGSVVVCLEDSIPDNRLQEAEANLQVLLKKLHDRGTVADLPLIFVRIRNASHLKRVGNQNKEYLHVLTGFVFPKFEDLTGAASDYLYELREINENLERPLYFMPVLESENIIHRETRKVVLNGLKSVIDTNHDLLLAVRIGATDMSSVYGLRRSPDFTVYDVHVISSAIADVVNVFGRSKDGYTITGAVWEHFTSGERLFKPQLRSTLFVEAGDPDVSRKNIRQQLLTSGQDSLIREIQLDKINGITGKTIIHPSHIPLVHALSVVTHEEYSDALEILNESNSSGGATSSAYKNKMNEIKPHHAWARKTLVRAKAFGVANEGIDFVDFLEASL